MKKARRFAACILTALLASTLCASCVSVAINEGKDLSTAVLTIGDEKFSKEDFLAFYASNQFLGEAQGATLPVEAAEITAAKEELYSYYVTYQLMKKEVEAQGAEIDDSDLDEKITQVFDAVHELYPDEADYNAKIAEYAADEAALTEQLKAAIRLTLYPDAFKKLTVPELTAVNEEVCATVGGVKIPRYTMYYYIVMNQIMYYAGQSDAPESEAAQYKEAVVGAVTMQSYINYAKANGMEPTAEEVKAMKADSVTPLEQYLDAYYPGTFDGFLAAFYITSEEHMVASNQYAKAMVSQKKIEETVRAGIEPTEDEIAAYYAQNLTGTYGPSITAKHILVATDEAFANEILAEINAAPDKAAAMDAAMEKYGEDERVTAAEDLGTFNSSSGMVTDFWDGVWAMSAGQAAIVKTEDFGYHVVYVSAKKTEADDYEAIKEQVKEDYIDSIIGTRLSTKLSEIYAQANKKEGKYMHTPAEAFEEVMDAKYAVKRNESAAVR